MENENVSTQRLARLRESMTESGLDAFYVRSTTNIQWLTSFEGVFDTEQAHALIVTPFMAELHTDSRYFNACRKAAVATKCPMTIGTTQERHAEVVKRNWETFCSAGHDAEHPGHIGVEDTMTLGNYNDLVQTFTGQASATECACGHHHHHEGHEHGTQNASNAAATESVAAADEVELAAAADATDAVNPANEEARSALPHFVATKNLIFKLRAIKDADEIERLKAAQAITDAALTHMLGFIHAGMTEREVQLELDNYMLTHGAEGLSFSTIVATGANGANPHAIPGDTKLEAGQCVVMDFGAKARGYCSDMTRTIFLGAPEGEMLKAWETMRRANETVQERIRPGVTGIEMHKLAEQILAEGGFEGKMGHGLGHGVGLDIHEEPCLNLRNNKPLEAGNVVTVEPGIYLAGKFGMRLEDFGIVTENGFDRFTQSTHEMIVL